MIRVTENLPKIRDLLRSACLEADRDPESVILLAVSKRQSLESMRKLAESGHRDFGENMVQEALEKMPQMADFDLTWHFIGHLQSNKTRAVAEHFDWVHTVDRLKTARRLSDQRPPDRPDLQICLQVNLDDEDAKSGVAPQDLLTLAKACAELPRIRLRGLMCLPKIRNEFAEQREPFAKLRQLANELQEQGIPMDCLSMGMSNDYRAAIVEGATIIRVGTALFGPRQD